MRNSASCLEACCLNVDAAKLLTPSHPSPCQKATTPKKNVFMNVSDALLLHAVILANCYTIGKYRDKKREQVKL